MGNIEVKGWIYNKSLKEKSINEEKWGVLYHFSKNIEKFENK